MADANRSPKEVSSSCPNLNLDDLADDILVEILHRLPYKQAFVCKSVSKRWNSLISGRQFLLQFISRWQYLFQQHDQHCSFVANSSHLLLIPNLASESLDLNLETALSSLNSIPSLPNESLQSDRVLGHSNGLLLLNLYHADVNGYVVFDMITKQLIQLPPHLRRSTFLGGLVCERNYYMETAERAIKIAGTKFFVVLATRNMCNCCEDNELQIYSSETGQWQTLSLNFPTRMLLSAGVSHHGLLYFFCSPRGFLVCDPMLFTSYFFRSPYDKYRETDYNAKEQCIGVCCGTLRLCQATYLSCGTVNVMVWELGGFNKETELGFWESVHDVYLGPDDWKNCGPIFWLRRRCRGYFSQLHDGRKLQIEPLAFHPYNGDILYLKHRSSIFSCNLRNKTLEDIPVSGNVDYFRHSMANTFPIMVPCWPANP